MEAHLLDPRTCMWPGTRPKASTVLAREATLSVFFASADGSGYLDDAFTPNRLSIRVGAMLASTDYIMAGHV